MSRAIDLDAENRIAAAAQVLLDLCQAAVPAQASPPEPGVSYSLAVQALVMAEFGHQLRPAGERSAVPVCQGWLRERFYGLAFGLGRSASQIEDKVGFAAVIDSVAEGLMRGAGVDG